MWWKCCVACLGADQTGRWKKRNIMCTDILAAVFSAGKHIHIFILLFYDLGVGQCETSPVCFVRVIWKGILSCIVSCFFMNWTISLESMESQVNLLNMWTKSNQVSF